MTDITELLFRIDEGDAAATEELLPLVYNDLRRAALAKLRNERPDHTLQATALVHEAYLRLVKNESTPESWGGRGHFFAAAAEAMRRILIESIRQKNAQKRGGGLERMELDTLNFASAERDSKLLSLDSALEQLEEIDAIKANLVKLRFFAGLTKEEAARALGISTTTADRYWAYARSWLQKAMREE